MQPDELPYALTGSLTEDGKGRALAAAGVLEAAYGPDWSQQPSMLASRLHELVSRSAGGGFSFRWIPPRHHGPRRLTDLDLAAAWQSELGGLKGRGPSRLLVDGLYPGRSASADALLGDLIGRETAFEAQIVSETEKAATIGLDATLRQLQAPLLAQRGSLGGWKQFGPDLIGAIALRTEPRPATGQTLGVGTWPPFVDARSPGDEPYLVLGPNPPEGDTPAGFTILSDQQLRLHELLQRAAGSERWLAALVQLAPHDLDAFLTRLEDEVARGTPADFALTSAWLSIAKGAAAPLFLWTDEDWLRELGASQLNPGSGGWSGAFEDLWSSKPTGSPMSVPTAPPMPRSPAPFDRAEAPPPASSPAPFGPEGPQLNDPFAGYTGSDFPLPAPFPTDFLPPDTATEEEEADRYADLTVFSGRHHGTRAPDPALRLGAAEALKPSASYTLAVAIRKDPNGIPSVEEQSPVRSPRQGREDVTILAVVSCRQAFAPVFEERVVSLTWPYDCDSDCALFRFTTGLAPTLEPLRIEVRLYARTGLQLLDQLELTFTAEGWAKRQPEPGPISLPPAGAERDALSLHVTAEAGGYGFEVIFLRDGKEHLVTSLGRRVTPAELDDLLLRVRTYWTRLVIGKLGTRPGLTSTGYGEAVREIADLGAAAWRRLFGDRFGSSAGTSETLGKTLRQSPLPPDSLVRITLDEYAEGFTFPWSILCPPRGRDEVPDPAAIWGLRHRIELSLKERPSRRPVPSGTRPRIATVLDPSFGSSVDHRATLAAVTGGGALAELLEGNSEKVVLDRLEAEPPADLYYYFCHGFAPGRGGPFKADVLKEIAEAAASLPQAEKAPWTKMLALAGDEARVAAMFTGEARITEDRLRDARFFAEERPIVFLNMCHSADLQPSLRAGLTHVFIDRQAAAVLGTECPVTSVFADRFAAHVLGLLLAGQTVGEAVLAARRHFHDARNPLGLLYTLYGQADARLTAPPLATPVTAIMPESLPSVPNQEPLP